MMNTRLDVCTQDRATNPEVPDGKALAVVAAEQALIWGRIGKKTQKTSSLLQLPHAPQRETISMNPGMRSNGHFSDTDA